MITELILTPVMAFLGTLLGLLPTAPDLGLPQGTYGLFLLYDSMNTALPLAEFVQMLGIYVAVWSAGMAYRFIMVVLKFVPLPVG